MMGNMTSGVMENSWSWSEAGKYRK